MAISAKKDDADDNADCIKNLRASFSNHDQNVDVVSCWESIFRYRFMGNGCGIFFDRFPEMGENGLTPDFTMLLSNDYGIVGEISRSFEKYDESLLKKAQQLKKYDDELEFKADVDGNKIVPKAHDILLLLHSDYSNACFVRLMDFWKKNKEMKLKNNLIIIDYNYSSVEATSRYMFKKILHDSNGRFRDSALPLRVQLEPQLGKRQKPLKVTPEHYYDLKSVNMFCNDEPPPIYLATRLWDRIFFAMLTPDEIRIWKKTSSTKVIKITTSCEELLDFITHKMVPGSRIEKNWIENSLKFLEVTGRAKRNGQKWEILYSNLRVRKRNRPGIENGEKNLECGRVYGDILADMYCRGLKGEPIDLEEEPRETVQKAIFDFDNSPERAKFFTDKEG